MPYDGVPQLLRGQGTQNYVVRCKDTSSVKTLLSINKDIVDQLPESLRTELKGCAFPEQYGYRVFFSVKGYNGFFSTSLFSVDVFCVAGFYKRTHDELLTFLDKMFPGISTKCHA